VIVLSLAILIICCARYSVAMQVICDVDKRIVGYHIGYPGSCADSSVFKKMSLYKNPHLYFSPGEYLADSAYSVPQTCVPAYKSPAANLAENTDFNYCLSKSRVRVEHCIGILKSRWSSLQQMRQQLRTKTEMNILTSWVAAFFIICLLKGPIKFICSPRYSDIILYIEVTIMNVAITRVVCIY